MQWDRSPNAGFSNNSKPWLPINSNYKDGVNVEDQSNAQAATHLSIYKQLTQLRQNYHDSLTHTFLFSTEQVFSVLRHGQDLDIVIVMNIQEDSVNVNLKTFLDNIDSNKTEAEVLIRSSGWYRYSICGYQEYFIPRT